MSFSVVGLLVLLAILLLGAGFAAVWLPLGLIATGLACLALAILGAVYASRSSAGSETP